MLRLTWPKQTLFHIIPSARDVLTTHIAGFVASHVSFRYGQAVLAVSVRIGPPIKAKRDIITVPPRAQINSALNYLVCSGYLVDIYQ
jgi:hypothetical protein